MPRTEWVTSSAQDQSEQDQPLPVTAINLHVSEFPAHQAGWPARLGHRATATSRSSPARGSHPHR